jgi:DNA-binding transcriptional LysR family regulator
MEVHQLQILRELGDLGSVKAVASALYVTPSAVSQQLALLQRNIHVPLTRKEGRNLVLTEAGEVLAAAGASVVSSLAAARAAIGEFQESPAAPVTVAGFHSVGQALFGPLLAKLEAPGAPVPQFFDEDVAQQDFPALTARYDLVLAHRMDYSPPWPADRVVVSALAHEPLDIALPSHHRLAARETLRPADLVGGGVAFAADHPALSPGTHRGSSTASTTTPPSRRWWPAGTCWASSRDIPQDPRWAPPWCSVPWRASPTGGASTCWRGPNPCTGAACSWWPPPWARPWQSSASTDHPGSSAPRSHATGTTHPLDIG